MNRPSGISSSKRANPNISSSKLTTRKKISVLVVDDDPIVRSINKAFLNKFELETHVAKNGKEAVEFCNSGIHFDLILMDMEMPIMDGPKATRELRTMGINSKIIGLTSRDLDPEKQAFLAAGLDDCLGKPLNSHIVETLLQGLGTKGKA